MSHNRILAKHPISLIAIGLLLAASVAQAAALYVSPAGDDSNPGTLQAPFKTITNARDAVKAINTNMKEDIFVYLRGGNYHLTSPINFTPADGGSGGDRIYYLATNN